MRSASPPFTTLQITSAGSSQSGSVFALLFALKKTLTETTKQLLLAVMPANPARTATLLIVVWALEQNPDLAGAGSARRSKKKVTPVATVINDAEEEEQDVFVPWRFRDPEPGQEDRSFQRYYHLFRHGELTALVNEAAASIVRPDDAYQIQLTFKDNGSERWERENWVAEVAVTLVAR